MPITPITVDGFLRIQYNVSAFVHKHDTWCDIDGTGSGAQIESQFGGLILVDPAVAASRVWDRIRWAYNSGTTNAAWTLFLFSGGAAIPQSSGTIALAGESASASVLADQLSLTFADIGNRRVNDYWFETVLTPPGKSIVNTTPADLQDYIEGWTAPLDEFDIGSWGRSRNDSGVGRFLRWTNGLNDKLQRLRGLK